MATRHVIDTHAFLWYLAGSTQLGSVSKAILQDPESELFLRFLSATAATHTFSYSIGRNNFAGASSAYTTIISSRARVSVT